MALSTERPGVCPCCGACFYPCAKGGRPARFCSDNCREVWKFFYAFERRLKLCTLAHGYKKQWRSELFCCANDLS